MIIGEAVGELKMQRSLGGTAHLRWIQVRADHSILTALDPMGVEPGDMVLLAVGESAWRLCPEIPTDAAVVGVVSQNNG